MRSGNIEQTARTAASLMPFRGGSTTTVSGLNPRVANSSAALPASAQINSAFSTPFAAAFAFAFSTASRTISAPMTREKWWERQRLIVPAPQ